MWQAVDLIHLVQVREQRWVVVNLVVNFRVP
jgi:hypothetical protein